MGISEKKSAIARFLQIQSAVVEVLHGESENDAWRRYLADNPDGSRAHVKIFHYPEPAPRNTNNPDILQLRRRENLS